MEELAKEPVKITSYLAESLPAQSTFFICYIMLRSFTGLSLELLRVVDLIVIPVKRRWFCYTPREDEAAWRPPPIMYDRVVCHCTFRGTQRQFSENICSEDDLKSRIFG